MELTTKDWKEFRIGDLFNYERGKESAPNQNPEGECKLISETQDNNGFVRFVEPTRVIEGHCITVSVNFASTVFYQDENFCASVNIIVLRPKVEMTEKQLLFIASILCKKHKTYSYTDKVSKDLLMNEFILLPSKNDEPDWDFMEEFIKGIEEKYIENVDEYNQENIDKALSVTGLTMADLDDDLKVEPADRYEEFKVGDLFESIGKTALINNFTKQDFADSNYTIPALSSVTTNNSMGFYVKESEHNVINDICLSVTANGINTGTLFLQTRLFAIAQDAYVIRIKNQKAHNVGVYLFLKVLIEKVTRQKYNYENKAGWNKVKNEKIKLPAIDEDTPDFDYMEKAIYIYILKRSLSLGKWITKKKLEL